MIPYTVTFIFKSNNKEHSINFETNEKPVKGEIFTIEGIEGSSFHVKIMEVNKVVKKTGENSGTIEYRCQAEVHEESNIRIGFGNRS